MSVLMKKMTLAGSVLALAFSGVGIINAQPPDGPGGSRGQRQPGGPGGFRGEGGPGGFRGEGGPGGPGGFRGPGGPSRGFPPMPIMTALDKNGDGELSESEIKDASKALMTLDKDKNGVISQEEMRPNFGPGGPGGPGRGNMAAQMVEQMMENDKNKDGKLSASELPERMRPLMTRADTNKDRSLDKEELTRFVEQQQGAQGSGPGGGRPGPGGEGRQGFGREGGRPGFGGGPGGQAPQGRRGGGDRPQNDN